MYMYEKNLQITLEDVPRMWILYADDIAMITKNTGNISSLEKIFSDFNLTISKEKTVRFGKAPITKKDPTKKAKNFKT